MTKTPEMWGEVDGMVNEKRQNGETNPLELFNKSIDFVRRFHWFCWTNPLKWVREIVGLGFQDCRFYERKAIVLHGKHGKHRQCIAHTEITEITEIVLLTQKARGVIAHTEIMENTEIVSIKQKARKGQDGDGYCDSSDSW